MIIFALVLISNAILHPNCKSRGRQYKIAFGCVSTTFSISVRGASHVRNDSKTLCLLYVTPTPCSHTRQACTHTYNHHSVVILYTAKLSKCLSKPMVFLNTELLSKDLSFFNCCSKYYYCYCCPKLSSDLATTITP